MLVRSAGIRALRQCAHATKPRYVKVTVRRFSAAPTPPVEISPTAHPLAGVASQLDHIAPRFEIEPSQIEILDSPNAFYETLKVHESLGLVQG